MKNIIGFAVGFSLLLPLVIPAVASARSINTQGGSLDCDTGLFTTAGGATSTMSTDACNGGGAPQGIMTEPWGLMGNETPIVAPGAVMTDQYGNSFTCPVWFPQSGCYDLTHTAWYLNQVHSFLHIKA